MSEKETAQLLEYLEGKFGEMNDRFTRIDSQLENLDKRLEGIGQRINRLALSCK